MRRPIRPRPPGWQAEPTDRELDCMRAVLQAESALGAARLLGLSESTVKNHLRNLYVRLEVRTMLGALKALEWLKKEYR